MTSAERRGAATPLMASVPAHSFLERILFTVDSLLRHRAHVDGHPVYRSIARYASPRARHPMPIIGRHSRTKLGASARVGDLDARGEARRRRATPWRSQTRRPGAHARSARAIHAGSKPATPAAAARSIGRLDQREARDDQEWGRAATAPGPVLAGPEQDRPLARRAALPDASGMTRKTAVPGTRTSAKARSACEREAVRDEELAARGVEQAAPNAARRAKPAATISATLQSAAR